MKMLLTFAAAAVLSFGEDVSRPSRNDVERQVRHAVESDPGMSASARKVRFAWRGDTLVVQGPVNRLSDVDAIGRIAKEAAGAPVKNELVVIIGGEEEKTPHKRP